MELLRAPGSPVKSRTGLTLALASQAAQDFAKLLHGLHLELDLLPTRGSFEDGC